MDDLPVDGTVRPTTIPSIRPLHIAHTGLERLREQWPALRRWLWSLPPHVAERLSVVYLGNFATKKSHIDGEALRAQNDFVRSMAAEELGPGHTSPSSGRAAFLYVDLYNASAAFVDYVDAVHFSGATATVVNDALLRLMLGQLPQ